MHQHLRFRIILAFFIFIGILTMSIFMQFRLKGESLTNALIHGRENNMMSQNSEFRSEDVVVNGIQFETLVPNSVVDLPKYGEETSIQFGVRITNQTSKPYRFDLQSFVPEVSNPQGQLLMIDGGRNSSTEAKSSDIPLIPPGESVSFLMNARFIWNGRTGIVLRGNAFYGGVWQYYILQPGTYQVRFRYTSFSQKQKVILFEGGRAEIDNFWVGEVHAPFSKLILQ